MCLIFIMGGRFIFFCLETVHSFVCTWEGGKEREEIEKQRKEIEKENVDRHKKIIIIKK